MGFVSAYLKEQKRYTAKELSSVFSFTNSETEKFLKDLKSFGVVKAVKNEPKQKDLSDLLEEDIEISDNTISNDEFYYVFTFVGVIVYGNKVLKCYPKYISSDEPLDEIKQVLKVLNKYSASEQIVKMFNASDQQMSFNLLAIILYLLQDYYENNIYVNVENIIETNGEGNILWNQTINDGFAIIRDNHPYYVDLYTSRVVNDEYDFFTRLHKVVLTSCSKQLEDSDLLSLFDFDSICLSEEKLADFGELDYILYRIQNELNVQFNTRKQLVLKSLYAFISQQKSLTDIGSISLFGTTNFNLVWEKVCSEVFDNKLNTDLKKLKLPIELKEKYHNKGTLIDIIEKPLWYSINTFGDVFYKESADTLRPDLISIYNDEERYVFVIFDAKYYRLQLEKDKVLSGNPGVGDVTKQFLYQLAYKSFVQDHCIDKVFNCFLMPTECTEVKSIGYTTMPMLENLNLEHIEIRLMPASYMYHCYLENRKLSFKDANLMI